VARLLKQRDQDLEALNTTGETALLLAVSQGDKGIVQLLLQNGADPSVRRGSHRNTTIYEAVYRDIKSILQLLLGKSVAAIDVMSYDGETPLYLAVKKLQKSYIDILLDHGADPNLRPKGQESMLNIVVGAEEKYIAQRLVQKGANTEDRNKD